MKMHLIATLVAGVALTASPTFADPIVVTGGHVVVPSFSGSNFPPFGFQLIGENTNILGLTYSMTGHFIKVDADANLSNQISLSSLPFHDEQVEGRFFNDVVLRGVLNLTATPVRITRDSTEFQTPFTMSGSISLFDFNGGFPSDTPFLTAALSGRGFASTGYFGEEIDGSFRSSGIFYSFEPAPASAMPEPGTLTLLAGGLATIAIRTKRRRRSS
jgi:hypothetical protein